ncbi:MAG: hypothetical protein CVT70_19980, partial [Alphaproteobacteria bacterium HGW-Alphaproteobacteria-1]
CHQSLHHLKTVIQIFLQKGILCESNNQAVGMRLGIPAKEKRQRFLAAFSHLPVIRISLQR